MRRFTCLLYTLLALLLLPVASHANEIPPGDPDTWSTPFERFAAAHLPGYGVPLTNSDATFILVCNPDDIHSYIQSVQHLKELQEKYLKSQSQDQYTCIANDSLRLNRPNGGVSFIGKGDEEGLDFRTSYLVVRDDADSQIVELRYRDFNSGIYDSFFKYEVRKDRVIPLERWIVGRGLHQTLFFYALILLALLFAVGLYQFFHRRE
jgi:hypothetical protein